MRLSKLLASRGVASRRKAEELIFEGRVSVNGDIVKVPQTDVTEDDTILVDGQETASAEKKIYFLLNKPEGYYCTHERPTKNTRLVIDIFSHLPQRLFTAGRLDGDTTGLIIVTNDGHFAHQLIHPSFNHTKEYIAKTGQEIMPEHLEKLSSGARVQGTWIKPVQVKKVRRGTIKVTIREGKKHEVRILLASAGLEVRELSRIRIGPYLLGNLQPGEYRELSAAEIGAISEVKKLINVAC
ncbi:MAG: pseudouridine synthase [Chlamydiales bacterium]